MMRSLKFVETFLIVLFVKESLSSVEDEKFIVGIYENPLANKNESFRCYGTVISARHILVSAQCADVSNSTELKVKVQFEFDIGEADTTGGNFYCFHFSCFLKL
jgi:hypothetical protein